MHTVEEIVGRMSSQGLRVTDQRRTLAKLFADTPGYLAPKDVYEFMGKTYSGLSFDTVYRNLRVLEELGVLEQVMFEDGVKFKLHCSEHHHHHHLICLQCGLTHPIVFCPMEQTAVPDDFKVVKHKFEVFGYCKACSSEEEAKGEDEQ
ncbi:transcriptional repressor [Paenibacillus sp. J5C_2022]|uniref:Fur family transcriptional regulator n=1 Tax=Paenibacillus sp. J5C2022 TaxID=2977129 RepID=UPI0021CE818E|nr:Fur family transcriptional regulator [Paenibacillus sp. J5C2022]MCU6707713.1 transcriptional repressor [Paenibacillus sp. J5C2022]